MGWPSIVILVAVIVIFYFLLIRPQKKQEKQADEMRNNLKVGDEVTTIGGIVGKIVSVREETVVLETTKDKTHIRFLRAAVRSVDVAAEDSAAPKKKEVAETPANKKNKKAKQEPEQPQKAEPATEEPDIAADAIAAIGKVAENAVAETAPEETPADEKTDA